METARSWSFVRIAARLPLPFRRFARRQIARFEEIFIEIETRRVERELLERRQIQISVSFVRRLRMAVSGSLFRRFAHS